MSITALAAAAIFGQYLLRTVRADRGFETRGVVTASTDLFVGGIEESRGRVFFRSVADRLQALQQVESAAWTTFFPMNGSGGGNRRDVEVRGFATPDGNPLSVVVDTISPGYLRTLRIPLVKGRE